MDNSLIDNDNYSNDLDMYSSGQSQEDDSKELVCCNCKNTFSSVDKGSSSTMCGKCSQELANLFMNGDDDDDAAEPTDDNNGELILD